MPAHAGLPWRVYTTERARSYVNASARPPFEPTWIVLTAGYGVEVLALEYSVATAVAPLSVYRSAVPWNCIVCETMPTPGPVAVFTSK